MSLTKVTYSMINGPMVCTTDYGAKGDGSTNDYDALMDAHDNAPDGATILVKGACYYESPLVFTRRLNWVCPGENDYFKPNVGVGNDALTIRGGSSAADLHSKINMYSAVDNACANALVLDRYWMSSLSARVQVGCPGYAFKVIGALESRFYLRHGVNFGVPDGLTVWYAANHLKLERNTTAPGGPYSTNACEFYVNFSGRVNGIITDNLTNEGDNTFRGTIQGLTGTPFYFDSCTNVKLTEMHLEGNDLDGAFVSCTNAAMENVWASSSNPVAIISSIGTTVKNYVGGLNIYSNSSHTKIIDCRIDGDSFTDSSATTEMVGGGVTSSASANFLVGGGGASPIENIFQNPFVDIWTNGAASAPDGFAAGSATFARETSTVYPLNAVAVSAAVTSTATALANMTVATPSGAFAGTSGARWVSFTTPVYVATGQPDLIVYVFDGATYTSLQTVSTKDTWVVVRGSILIGGGGSPSVVFAPWNGSAFVAGNFYVGGLSIVNGVAAPKFLIDSGRRLDYVVGSVSNTPAFIGQRAFISGTGKWYMAKGTASSADWIILN